MKTAVACPEPPRRRNEPFVWLNPVTTTGNTRVDWVRIDVKQ